MVRRENCSSFENVGCGSVPIYRYMASARFANALAFAVLEWLSFDFVKNPYRHKP
jgi:hypothetical protein